MVRLAYLHWPAALRLSLFLCCYCMSAGNQFISTPWFCTLTLQGKPRVKHITFTDMHICLAEADRYLGLLGLGSTSPGCDPLSGLCHRVFHTSLNRGKQYWYSFVASLHFFPEIELLHFIYLWTSECWSEAAQLGANNISTTTTTQVHNIHEPCASWKYHTHQVGVEVVQRVSSLSPYPFCFQDNWVDG